MVVVAVVYRDLNIIWWYVEVARDGCDNLVAREVEFVLSFWQRGGLCKCLVVLGGVWLGLPPVSIVATVETS